MRIIFSHNVISMRKFGSKKMSKMVAEIDRAIDLNRILARAEAEKQTVKLVAGVYNKTKDCIEWGMSQVVLSYNYDISYGLMYSFIHQNQNKIIRINTTKMGPYTLNRNIVIHVPIKADLDRIRREFLNIVVTY